MVRTFAIRSPMVMREDEAVEILDAETEFRRRLSLKLAARGYEGPALQAKIGELLRLEINLRLNISEISGT